MNIQNKIVNVSGTNWGVGSQSVSCVLLLATSGEVCIPVTCDSTGAIDTY